MIKRGLKKAQVAVFVIIAIVVLVVVVVLFFSGKDLDSNSHIPAEVRPIYSYVNDCVDSIGQEAVYYIGQTGGYFDVPEPSYFNVAYYLYGGENHMPSKEFVEEQLEKYVNFALYFCTANFIDFEDFEVIQGNISSKVVIKDEEVIFEVYYPLSISKGDASYTLNDFEVAVPVKLGVMYDAVEEFIAEQIEDRTAVCASCLYDIGQQYELDFHVLDTNENESIMFIVRDEELKLYNEDYLFYFLNKLEEEVE